MKENKKVIFCNIAWMKYYLGESEDDKPINGGEYVKKYGEAVEATNFVDYNHYCYGFVRFNGGQIHIERCDKAYSNQEQINNITVIWVASDGKKKSRIVGWYRNATIYRYEQYKGYSSLRGLDIYYNIKAKSKDCYLLPEENRTFIVPRASREGGGKGMGQSPIWFADSEYAQNEYIPKVLEYIDSYDGDYIDTYISDEDLLYSEKIDETDVDKIIDMAKRSNDLRQGLYYINSALKYERTPEILINRAIYLKELYMFDEAIEDLKEALYKDSNNINCMENLMCLYRLLDKNFLAIQLGERIIKLLENEKNDLFYDMFYKMIHLYLNEQEYSKAKELVERYERFDTDYRKENSNYFRG